MVVGVAVVVCVGLLVFRFVLLVLALVLVLLRVLLLLSSLVLLLLLFDCFLFIQHISLYTKQMMDRFGSKYRLDIGILSFKVAPLS